MVKRICLLAAAFFMVIQAEKMEAPAAEETAFNAGNSTLNTNIVTKSIPKTNNQKYGPIRPVEVKDDKERKTNDSGDVRGSGRGWETAAEGTLTGGGTGGTFIRCGSLGFGSEHRGNDEDQSGITTTGSGIKQSQEGRDESADSDQRQLETDQLQPEQLECDSREDTLNDGEGDTGVHTGDGEGYGPGTDEPVETETTSDPCAETAECFEYLGDWTISFYCPCESCCGVWAYGATASGVMPQSWHTAATSGLDFGTVLYVDGLGYFTVEDRGTDYGWLDVFVSDHGEALANGLQCRAVYRVR